MTEVTPENRKRKVLQLKTESRNQARQEAGKPPKYLQRDDSWFMVWCVGGDEPKRIYSPSEVHIALRHAHKLSQETGKEFHVMRSWRGFGTAAE